MATASSQRKQQGNGMLKEATKEEVADQLHGGTQRSYDVFAQCQECGRAYWKGAHHEQLVAGPVEDQLGGRVDDDLALALDLLFE